MGKRARVKSMFLVPFVVALAAGASRALAGEGEGYHLAAVLSWEALLATVVYGLVGMALAFVGYKVYSWIVPFDLNKELAEDDNPAVGIVVGAVILGVSIIVAAAIV